VATAGIGAKAVFLARMTAQTLRRLAGQILPRPAPQPADFDIETLIEALQSRDAAALAAFGTARAKGADAQGQPWLFYALDLGSVAAVQGLLAQGAQASGFDRRGRAALQAAVERSLEVDEFEDDPEDPLPMLALLVAAGAEVNLPDALGLAPLHHAARLGAERAARELLALGALRDQRDAGPEGLRPADYAARAGFAGLAALLA
jgi:hypothetical protein